MKNTKQNKTQNTNVVLNTTNETFTPMLVSITIKQGANVVSRIIEQKKYHSHFSAIIGTKFDMFKELFNGKNKVFDASLELPITFELHIEHEVYNDVINGVIETSNAKKICMLLNSEFCKTFKDAPSFDVVLLERTKFMDRKNKLAMPKDERHNFVGIANKLETNMLYPLAQLN